MHGRYQGVQLRPAFAAVVPMRPDPMIVTVDATTAILRVSVFTFPPCCWLIDLPTGLCWQTPATGTVRVRKEPPEPLCRYARSRMPCEVQDATHSSE